MEASSQDSQIHSPETGSTREIRKTVLNVQVHPKRAQRCLQVKKGKGRREGAMGKMKAMSFHRGTEELIVICSCKEMSPYFMTLRCH